MSRKKRKENCNRYRKGRELNSGDQYLKLVESVPQERSRNTQVIIKPKNFRQDDLLGHLEDPNVNIVFAIGPAGTGKTMVSTLAGIRQLKANQIDKFVLTRPAVSVDEKHGFLPGGLNEKMAPWVMPIMDVFEDYYTPAQIEYMLEDKKVEIAPLAYMRGRTFRNSFIIADEMQNATESQMKMLLSRIGEGSKLVVTGDLDQHDRGYESNGLRDFFQRMSRYQGTRIRTVVFEQCDIERHPVVREVLSLYGEI